MLVLCGTIFSLILVEVSLRVLLSSDRPSVVEATSGLRQAALWANQKDDELYWKLKFQWADPEDLAPAPNCPDPLLGWVSGVLEPGTYEHRLVARLESRRPVLLYGDSFAQGVTGRKGKFVHLFNDTDLGETQALINYGVGGYGVDQAYLLCKNSIGHFEGLAPIVIFSVLVDDDLDRVLLGFRSWPKPRLRVEPEGLVAAAPEMSDGAAYLEAHPPAPPSWIWSYLLNNKGLLPGSLQARLRGDEAALEAKQALFVAMMEDLKRDLDGRDIEWFVLIFVGRRALISREPKSWHEPFVVETLERLQIPHVNTRPDLYAFMNEHGLRPRDLYILEGHGKNHLNRLGNMAAVQTFVRGIRGEFDPYEYVPGVRLRGAKRPARPRH